MDLKPDRKELQFLTLGYNRFYDLFDEVMLDGFWEMDSFYRLSKVTQAFSIYTETLQYEPIKYSLELIKKHRPPMEYEIGKYLFKFIRNTLLHFPFYKEWDDIWLNMDLINWNKKGQSIDSFLKKFSEVEPIKYRFWEEDKKLMTYLSINFPKYDNDTKIYLKDIISEKEGVKFSFIMMKQILNTQVESIEEKAETV